jgi:hypothetical protein
MQANMSDKEGNSNPSGRKIHFLPSRQFVGVIGASIPNGILNRSRLDSCKSHKSIDKIE